MYLGKLHKFDVDSRQTGHYHPLMDQISCLVAYSVLFWPLACSKTGLRWPLGVLALYPVRNYRAAQFLRAMMILDVLMISNSYLRLIDVKKVEICLNMLKLHVKIVK